MDFESKIGPSGKNFREVISIDWPNRKESGEQTIEGSESAPTPSSRSARNTPVAADGDYNQGVVQATTSICSGSFLIYS